MSIVILKTRIENDPATFEPASRGVTLWISNGTTNYVMQVGGLALTGSLQTILNGMEADLWAMVNGVGTPATSTENEIAGAILYYKANAGMKTAVFDKSVAQSDIDIGGLVASISGLNAAQRTGLKQLLMSSLLDTRVNAHDRDLV